LRPVERNHLPSSPVQIISQFSLQDKTGYLQGMGTASRVIYISAFSQVLSPSLRLGYAVIPPTLLSAFFKLRETLDIFSQTLYQFVLTDFLQEGHFGVTCGECSLFILVCGMRGLKASASRSESSSSRTTRMPASIYQLRAVLLPRAAPEPILE
jgi:hypothetical protein